MPLFPSHLSRRAAAGLLRGWARSGLLPTYCHRLIWWYGAAAGDELRPARLPDGSRVECDLRDQVQQQMYFQGVYERTEAFLFARLVRPGGTVVDAGANVGQYTLLAASGVGPTGAVHSFEPVPATFARLDRHFRRNGRDRVTANRAALWHEPGEVILRLPAGETGNDGSYTVGATGPDGPAVTAPAVRFDDYAAEHRIGRVDLVKLDIEGAEWPALRGMPRTLARDRPLILAEVNRRACRRLGYDPRELWTLLGGLGYTAWAVGRSAARWRRLADPAGVDLANVLFCPGELPAAVARGWDHRRCLRWARSGGAA